MSLDTWMRLEDFKKQIEEDFPASEDDKGIPCKTCPPPPRVHVVYAHYGARPRLPKNVDGVWYFATLPLYKACVERKWSTVALDYLGSHFLWVLTTGVTIVKLPSPPTVLPIPPTAIDGGTLVHFVNTTFSDQKKAGDEAVTGKGAATGVKQGQTVFATITLPLDVQDKDFVHQHGDKVTEVAHPPPKKQPPPPAAPPSAANPDPKAPPKPKQLTLATPASPTAPPAPFPDIEGASWYPKLRRLCLSQVGKTGDHHVVDASSATVTTQDFVYLNPQEDATLRELCISPWFNFVQISGAESSARQKLLDKGETPTGPASVLGNPAGDPWKDTTRGLPWGDHLWETTSNVYCGKISGNARLADGRGIDKSLEAPTTTGMLGDRFIDKIGRSRWLIFKAMSNIEGRCESIQTWDGPKLSWGINQWIASIPGGELWHVLAYIYDFFPDAFARRFGYFGIGLWFSGRKWTWSPDLYQKVTAYRVPCCGTGGNQDIRAGHDAVLKTALALKKPTGYTDDLPPWRERALADAFAITGPDSTSKAMCYLFTTAGADPEIQKAMAQWMSFRISYKKPRGAPISKVLGLFLKSLWEGIPEWQHRPRYAKAVATLNELAGGASLGSLEAKAAAKFPTLADTPAPKGETPDQAKARVAKNHAVQQQQDIDRADWILSQTVPHVSDILDEVFTDDDADEAWCYWPTRLRDAGKVGFGKEDKNLTDTSAAASTQKANEAQGAAAAAAKK